MDLNRAEPAASLYLDLLQGVLTRAITGSSTHVPLSRLGLARGADVLKHPDVSSWLLSGKAEVLMYAEGSRIRTELRGRFDPALREEGRDWPIGAETMIGSKRLDDVRRCVRAALAQDIPGDLVETGVWRGGACIFMRGILAAYGVRDRTVWACDSFEGLPKPNAEKYPQDQGLDFTRFEELAVSLDSVKGNFSRYGLLDDQVRFLKGWFRDTLPSSPIGPIAVLRLDGDLYESTWDALTSLYGRVSVGGFVLVDDYGDIPACKAAVDEFRAAQGITAPLHAADWTGVSWQREGA